MSKFYDKSAAAFKATTVDTKILDAQTIKIYPGDGSLDTRVNLLDLIGQSGGGIDDGQYVTKEEFEGIKGYTHETIPYNETTGDNGGEAFRITASRLPIGEEIDEIIVPTRNSPSVSFYMALYIIASSEPNDSSNKTLLAVSDNRITWTSGTDAIWTFGSKPVIPEGYDLEIHIGTSESDFTATGTTYRANGSNELKCRYKENATGQGACRYQTGWYGNRAIRIFFKKNGIQGHVGDNSHLTDRQISAIQGVIDGNYVTNETAQNFVTKEELDNINTKEQYYDTWTNLIDGDITDKADSYSFQLAKDDFVTGKIDRIEIPYVKGANSNGYLCVQFFDSSNNVIATYYSNNKQKQDKTGDNDRGLCEFEFNTFETPETYSHVRFALVQYSWTVPTGNSGLKFRIVPIKRNNTFTWNTNEKTRINNTGTRWTVLLSVLTRNYAKNTGISVRNYDWTPDVFCPINVTLAANGSVFVAPTNGWIISKSSQTTSGANSLKLNGIEIAKSSNTSQADLQILMRKGEFIGADTAYTLVFYPCKSEQFDYRLDGGHTMYDIWKGAVVYDEFGQPTVKDLYVPDASAWKSEVGSGIIGRIATISDEVAYDASGNFLFNIQSQHIENGKGLLVGSTITSWNASLANLRIGEQMFGYSAINTWNTALPLMWKGDNMFYGCSQLTTFNASLPALTSGWHMFTNCSSLTNVTIGSLVNLTDGTNMFKGCSLSYESLLNVLNALPQRTATIEITVADSAADDMAEDERFTDAEIPPFSGSTYFSFTHNGWEVRLTSQTGFIVSSLAPTPYDVTVANGYIPDASGWRGDMGETIVRNITRVSNEIAYNDNN